MWGHRLIGGLRAIAKGSVWGLLEPMPPHQQHAMPPDQHHMPPVVEDL